MSGEWRIKPEDDNTYTLTTPDGELVMRCYPDQEFAVAFYLDLLSQEVIDKYSMWMSRVVTLTEAAKMDQKFVRSQ